MSKAIYIVLGLFSVLTASPVFAYHLDDHSRIVLQAYDEFAACVPALPARLNVEHLVQADLDEDLNLINKWLKYSHFYHPHKDLRMWREDSAQRIDDIQPNLLQCRASAAPLTFAETADLGHAIHHLQDATVPAHVVPVNHAAWDGFESYAVSGDITSEWSCDEIVSASDDDMLSALKLTAEETLSVVQSLKIEAVHVNSRTAREFSGRDFWQAANGEGFGRYGVLGNSFGSVSVRAFDGEFLIADSAYREFKRQQLKRAVRSTLRALAWAFPQSRGGRPLQVSQSGR